MVEKRTPAALLQAPARRRGRLSQSDIPRHSLADALRVPRAIADQFGKQATRPMAVANALDISPGSSNWRYLSGAAAAYGLADGAYSSPLIALTDLGRRVVAPTVEGDDESARREAFLRPRIIREFLERYSGSRFPDARIARNVLEEMGVPREACERTLALILQGARELGFVKEIKGREWVDLTATPAPSQQGSAEAEGAREREPEKGAAGAEDGGAIPLTPPAEKAGENRRVFITHGKNRQIVAQLKELLGFGEFEPVVSVERETVAKPVPDKVLDDMRGCGAAIIHVGGELKCMDPDGNEHTLLNPNVLIEIGAAMALYSRRFILLVEEGVELPTNLQGLYEVRYKGEKLEYDATMKLLKAFSGFKT